MDIVVEGVKDSAAAGWASAEGVVVPFLEGFEQFKTLGETEQQIAVEGVILMVSIVAAHFAIFVVLKTFCKLDDVYSSVDNIFCIPFTLWLSYLALHESYYCMGTIETRWFSYTWKMKAFLWSYVIRSIFHMPYMFLCKMKNNTRLLLCVHHTVSAVSYFGGVYYNHMSCYGCLDGVCEISTFFLSMICFLRDFDMRTSPLHSICGVCLFLSYIFFRLILFPYWLFMFYTDITEHPEATWDKVGTIQRYVYPATNVLLLILSAMWMVPITKGMLKALRPPPKQKTG